MGVPSFFRWLQNNYPLTVIPCHNDSKFDPTTGKVIPQDPSLPNCNGVEFDNLYLDMNGIIHPCTHPEDKPAPKNEDEMMVAIFDYIDLIFSVVRPRKLMYMAIDGVAPRAKMNQQRSRRFRSSLEAEQKKAALQEVRQELEAKGMKVLPDKSKEEHFDSNCITPGTPFMDRLSKCLHYYIHDKINNDIGWAKIKVILSDATVPGEGEHKIMDFIRKQRSQPNHDPNTHHVLCGADADLIMLGLATHEVNFTIIREAFKDVRMKQCELCHKLGHEYKDCEGLQPDEEFEDLLKSDSNDDQFIFVRLNVLREYLERELDMPNLPFEYDFERAIDDWVLICFFVGNDFLPHLPSLEIREKAINRLVTLYKECCYKTKGFLSHNGEIDMKKVSFVMKELGKVEDTIFRDRQDRELSFQRRNEERKLQEAHERMSANRFANQDGLGSLGIMEAGQTSVAHNARQGIKDQLKTNQKRRVEETQGDEVRLYEDGFKNRYYQSKFHVDPQDKDFRIKVANEYAVGLQWVMKYYFQGCPSWNWYFPYHYAPFASDFTNVEDLQVKFDLGQPFSPLEQLMGVFPPASRSHVPEPWGELMVDLESNIIDFYPIKFKIDLNGKKYAWQGVALLPFVDENRLKKALQSVYHLLTKEEQRRNVTGKSIMYVGHRHPSHAQLIDLYRMGMTADIVVPISGDDTEGMAGSVLLSQTVEPQNGTIQSPVIGLEPLNNNKVVCVKYCDPEYAHDFVFPARRLKNAIVPPKILKITDRIGDGFRGNRGRGRGGYRGRGFQHDDRNQFRPRHPNSRMFNTAEPPQHYMPRVGGPPQIRNGVKYTPQHTRNTSYDTQRSQSSYHNPFYTSNQRSGGSRDYGSSGRDQRDSYRDYSGHRGGYRGQSDRGGPRDYRGRGQQNYNRDSGGYSRPNSGRGRQAPYYGNSGGNRTS